MAVSMMPKKNGHIILRWVPKWEAICAIWILALGDDKKMSVIIIINYYYYYINALQYIHRTIANKKTEVQQYRYKETK